MQLMWYLWILLCWTLIGARFQMNAHNMVFESAVVFRAILNCYVGFSNTFIKFVWNGFWLSVWRSTIFFFIFWIIVNPCCIFFFFLNILLFYYLVFYKIVLIKLNSVRWTMYLVSTNFLYENSLLVSTNFLYENLLLR